MPENKNEEETDNNHTPALPPVAGGEQGLSLLNTPRLRAGLRPCAVSSEHRVKTTERKAVECVCLECWLGDKSTYSASREERPLAEGRVPTR